MITTGIEIRARGARTRHLGLEVINKFMFIGIKGSIEQLSLSSYNYGKYRMCDSYCTVHSFVYRLYYFICNGRSMYVCRTLLSRLAQLRGSSSLTGM